MASAAISAVASLVGGLFGAHAARIKGASNENQAMDEMVKGFDYGIQTIFSQANSGQMTAEDAINACQALYQQWWQLGAQFESQPGTARRPCSNNFSGQPGEYGSDGTPCDKTCTAICCVGCNPINASVQNCIYVFQNGGGTARIQKVFGTPKYGSHDRETYYMTYTPPPQNQIFNEVGDLFGFNSSSLIPGGARPGAVVGSNVVIYFVIGIAVIGLILIVRR